MLDSVWTDHTKMPCFPTMEQDTKTDVLIIGGGLAGILCLHRLAQDGADCMLIEADELMNGVSRNTTAKLTSQNGLIYDKLIRQFNVDTARRYYQANEAALERYRTIAQSINCDFEKSDSYLYSVDAPEKLQKELAALRQIRAPAEYLDKLPLPFPVAGAIRFQNQAQFHPLKFVSQIAKGLNIYEHTKACEFVGNMVLTDRGRIHAKKIVVATHFPIFNKHGSYFLKMYQQRSYVLALKGAPRVEGMYRDEAASGLSFRSYGDMLLLGGGGHRTGKRGDGWTSLETFAKIHYPEAREVCRWATQDCMTLDGVPYIGQYSSRTPDLYVATGFNKWGMTSSMVAAMILGDLLQGKRNPYASVFSPSRTILRPQLLANAIAATTNLLIPTKPRCPHLGCALKWNPWEHSWDCPCHGSRFTENGKLLDNPATDDMKNSQST